jgi:hypothetical protein
MSYTPGKPLILSRLPAQDWFTPDQAASASGWSPSYIKARIADGTIPAQSRAPESESRPTSRCSNRIHIDDLVLFILLNGQGRYEEKKSFADVVAVLRPWPLWMLKEMHKALGLLIEKRTARIAHAAPPATTASMN